MNEFFHSNNEQREIFFQNLLIENIKNLNFESAFEVGYDFEWNLKSSQDEFSSKRINDKVKTW